MAIWDISEMMISIVLLISVMKNKIENELKISHLFLDSLKARDYIFFFMH